MNVHLPAPRLLPVTMLAMAAVLAVKTAGLVRLAVPAHAEAPATAAPPTAAAPADAMPAPSAPPPPQATEAMTAMPSAMPPAASAPPISDSERALLTDLRHRRSELDARAQAVAARETVVEAAEKRLAVRLDELGALQQRLESLEAARKSRNEQSWQGLVHIYETMKAKDAATIFDDLDMPVLVQVMDRMQERKAAMVLAAMDPDRARELTIELADLRSNANKLPEPPTATRVSAPGSPPPASAAADAPAH